MSHIVVIATALLADDTPHHTGPDFGKASPLGLLVIVLLLLGTIALVWSMNRQLKKVPDSFEDDTSSGDVSTAEAPKEGSGDGQDA